MARQHQIDVDQLVDVVRCRLANFHVVARRGGCPARHRSEAVALLLAEADAEPRFHQRVVEGRHEHVVIVGALLDPARGRDCIQIAQVLRFLGGLPGIVDPPVLSPDSGVAR